MNERIAVNIGARVRFRRIVRAVGWVVTQVRPLPKRTRARAVNWLIRNALRAEYRIDGGRWRRIDGRELPQLTYNGETP